MASPVTAVASLLLLYAHLIIRTDSVVIPSSCCMSFISKKIPESRVVSYQVANGSVCPMAGVIFTTKKGQRLCSDPKQPWVRKYVRNLDAKRKQPPTLARALGIKVPVQRHRGNSTATSSPPVLHP